MSIDANYNKEEVDKYLGLKKYFHRLEKINQKIKKFSVLNFDARNPQFTEPCSGKSYLVEILEKHFSDYYESHLESGLMAILKPKENSVTACDGILGLEGIRERLKALGIERFVVGLNCGQFPALPYNRIIISDLNSASST